jgi:hypothetical protein
MIVATASNRAVADCTPTPALEHTTPATSEPASTPNAGWRTARPKMLKQKARVGAKRDTDANLARALRNGWFAFGDIM